MSKPITEKDVAAATSQLDSVRAEWLERPYVTGLDVGFHYEDGVRCEELAIRVHVLRARPELADDAFPSFLGTFPVDVIEAEYEPEC